MASDDERTNIRRQDDIEWLRTIDHQIVTLLTGHQVLDRRLTEIDETLKAIDYILRGDPLEGTDGLLTQMHQTQTDLSRLNAVIFQDSTGKAGALKDIEKLKSRENNAEHRWKFWTAIAVGVIGLLTANWDRIVSYAKAPSKDPVENMIDEAKHPRITHKRYRVVTKADE